jgi:hypothetical protein
LIKYDITKQIYKRGVQPDSTAAAQSKNFGMNTVMTHRAFGKNAEEALGAVRDEAARLELLLSRFIPVSYTHLTLPTTPYV